MDEMVEQTMAIINSKKVSSENFTKQIAFNAIPHIDAFAEDGYTKEELKMMRETKKILDDKIELTATCVRIPVKVSHAESVNIEFEKPFTVKKISETLNNSPGCKVFDKRENAGYITPVDAEGKNETFISRIREDNSKNNSLNLWIVSDNLLRGAALNAVEIAETYFRIEKMKNENPLSPHIQIYNWHISSLVSISHRITGIINFVSLTLICFWVSYLVLGKDNYELIFIFLNSFIGKFLILAIIWSFSFQILSEIRHLFWDYGIGFELKTANITGSLVIVGSFILTLLIFITGKKLFNMITATKKWIFLKLSAVVMLPLMIWFIFQLVSIYNMGFDEINSFFVKQPNKFLFSLFVVITYFYSALSISEVFEDYIVNEKLKNVANKTLYLFAIIMPIFTIFILYKLSL